MLKIHKYCGVCDKRLDRVNSWNVVRKNELILKLNHLKVGIKEGDRVCNICTDRARKLNNEEKIVENADFPDDNYDVNAHDQIVNNHDDQILVENEKSDELSSNETSSDENSEDIVNIDPTVFSLTKEQIYIDLARANYTEKKCVVCNKKRGKKNNKLHRISDKSITDAYIKTSVLIPFGCRVCKIHLDEYGFLKKSCLGKRMVFLLLLYYILFKLILYIVESLEPKSSNAKLPLNKISLLIKNLRNAAKHNNLGYQFSSIELLDETVCFKITGIS